MQKEEILKYLNCLNEKLLQRDVKGTDGQDIKYLIKELKTSTVDEVFQVVEKYYPRRIIKPATQFFLEELLDEMPDNSRN